MTIQSAARERDRIRDLLRNSIYNSDVDELTNSIGEAENAIRVHGPQFASTYLPMPVKRLKILLEKMYIQQLREALSFGMSVNALGAFTSENIEFEHLAAAIPKRFMVS